MKRPVFIIAGIVLVFILLGVWIYVLFFGSSEGNTFANLNFGDSTDNTVVVEERPQESEAPVIDVQNNDRLRQLTTKPTIGYQIVQPDASSTPLVYYAESGTGHIYSINTETGEEVRISGKTVPLSRKAEITPDGQYVMIRSGTGGETVVLNLSTSSNIVTTELNDRIADFNFTTSNTFMYSVRSSDSTTVKVYNPSNDTVATIFSVPLRDITFDWNADISNNQLIYPRTSGQLEGFLYEENGSSFKRLPIDGFGLSVHGNESNILYSKHVEGAYKTYTYNRESGDTIDLGFNVIPEKCNTTNYSDAYMVCASDRVVYDITTPDNWYKGLESYNDNLWLINVEAGSANLILNTAEESGRQLDIVDIAIHGDEGDVYMVNKKDQTLWQFVQFAE